MADLEFVDPGTGAALGTHAFGTVAAGATSASWAARLRYKWGQSGSGLNQNALVLEVSTDGGSTWQTDLAEFTLQVTAVQNVPLDPLFTGTTTSALRTTRLDLPALRAGCAYDLAIVFAPTLHTGAATTAYSWRLGVSYNESYREIALVPDAPTGILPGLGDISVNEWVTAPTLANATGKVTLGDCGYVHAGIFRYAFGADVTLNQDDGSSVTLGSGEEYVAVLSAGSSGITTTKGDLATAGSALTPAYPAGELPLAVVRVPYGGVIVTSTLLAVSGRCLVTDAGGLIVTVQPGRAVSPGMLAAPATVQTLTLADNSTVYVYLSESGVAGSAAAPTGIPLATVTTVGGDITVLTDTRRILRGQPIRLSASGTETAAANIARIYVPYQWTMDRADLRLMTPSAGATGSTDLVVRIDAIYELINDNIPAQDTAYLTPALLITTWTPGWITLECDGVTSGGTPAADIEVLLWITQVA